MPEYPDITVYLEAMQRRVLGQELTFLRVASPFLLRTVIPTTDAYIGRRVEALERIGKRIVLGFEGDLWLVLHLMVAGRLHWRDAGKSTPGKSTPLLLGFPTGTLYLTEAGKKKRASLHLVAGRTDLDALDPGGLNPLSASELEFQNRLTASNHTLKRALTDPRILSGIGNAYSDEILHRGKLSPFQMTQKLTPEQVGALYRATQSCLLDWTERLRRDCGEGFPEKVTAFREDMAVHGRFGKPCPDCNTAVQRIRYASNETNYCPRCQTEGRVLADRALSRLLKKDWPRTVEELEKPKN